MPHLFRSVSLLLRQRQSQKAVGKILRSFELWKKDQAELPAYSLSGAAAPRTSGKKLLIIRLDDIGDWLLFRNHFAVYKNSSRWVGHEVVLLGNSIWKDLFVALDHDKADRVIWVDKGEYLRSSSYRMDLWMRLRKEGFETVICPSRTRPLLLDDLCVLATGASHRLGSTNNFPDQEWNVLSDALYTELFQGGDPLEHEFYFNGGFAQWCCGTHFRGSRPEIEEAGDGMDSKTGVSLKAGTGADAKTGAGAKVNAAGAYILCFIGSSTKSKRWPVQNWIGLIRKLVNKQIPGANSPYKIVVAGGPQDMAMGGAIQQATDTQGKAGKVEDITGKVSLTEMIGWVGGAAAVVTNDTMAAHLGVSCKRPTLIIANGNNSIRFTDYAGAGIAQVVTLYPVVFLRKRNKRGKSSFHHVAVSADIASIGADVVAGELEMLIRVSGQ